MYRLFFVFLAGTPNLIDIALTGTSNFCANSPTDAASGAIYFLIKSRANLALAEQ